MSSNKMNSHSYQSWEEWELWTTTKDDYESERRPRLGSVCCRVVLLVGLGTKQHSILINDLA